MICHEQDFALLTLKGMVLFQDSRLNLGQTGGEAVCASGNCDAKKKQCLKVADEKTVSVQHFQRFSSRCQASP